MSLDEYKAACNLPTSLLINILVGRGYRVKKKVSKEEIDNMKHTCTLCRGTGKIRGDLVEVKLGISSHIQNCYICEGRGKVKI